MLQRKGKLVIFPRVIPSSCQKLSRLSAGKKSNLLSMLFWRYCKNIQTYFGYFGHAWLHTSRMIVSNCRRLQCLSTCQKYTLSFTPFLRYYNLKNPAIWLYVSILAHNFARFEIGGKISTILVFILDYFQKKLVTKFFKYPKNPILGPFWATFAQIWAKTNFPGKSALSEF